MSDATWAAETYVVGNTTYNKYYLQPPQIFERTSLPNFGISACVQDSQGFVWVGTESYGLIRWDGYDERAYKNAVDADRSIPTSFVTDLAVQDDYMWIGTGDAGVIRLNLNTDEATHFPAGEGETTLSMAGVQVVFVSSAGQLWVATTDGTLHAFDAASQGFERLVIFQELETEITAIVESDDGKLWLGTSSEGLFLFDPDKRRVMTRYASDDVKEAIISDSIMSLLMDAEGILWIGTSAGLDRFDTATKTVRHYQHVRGDRTSLADNNVRVLLRDRAGSLWVGTESGLHIMDKDGESFLQYVRDPDDQATTADFPRLISCGFQDEGGVLYFSDPTSGLYLVSPTKRQLSPYYYASQLTELIDVVEGEKPGIMWGTSFAQGLMRYDFNQREISVYSVLGDPESADSVRLKQWMLAIHLDRQGRLWAGGQSSGLIYFNPDTGDYRQFLNRDEQLEGITSNDVQDIKEGRDGSIWIATFGGGLNRFFPDIGVFQDFVSESEDESSLSSDYIFTIEMDRNNKDLVWIGTARGGLNRLNIDKETFTRYDLTPPDGKARDYDSIFVIYQQEDGVLWLGTDGGGLVRFDPKSGDKQYFGRAEGLPHLSIYGILPGDNGVLWLSTNGGGLVRFDPKGPDAAVFTKADGLTYDVFNQHGYLRTSDGHLVFTAGNGFVRFKPEDISLDLFTPPVAFTSFKVFNKERDLGSPVWSNPSIKLDYTDSVISFDFAGLSFAAPEQTRYMYKMDGLHDWTETTHRFVTYSNMEDGDYVFRVKAANHHGMWSTEESTLAITVTPPPWRTWWAYLIYGLLVLGLVWLYIRYQARKVAALEQAHRLETVENELALTGAVQTGFLPASDHLEDDLFNLAGFYRPADRAGGDWWWYETTDTGINVLIGDVTGHGPGPAMVTAAVATAYRIQSDLGVSMDKRLEVLNREVVRVSGGEYHMTISALEIDGRTGRFVFYSGGGLPAMRLHPERKPRLLPCPGTPLGGDKFNIGVMEGVMDPGERVVLYTDGIPEIVMPNGRLLGMRRFTMLIEQTSATSTQHAVEHIVRSADALRGQQAQDDDWTFVILEWTAGRS